MNEHATIEAPQGSEAWLQDRLGKATASRIADIMARTKSGPSASRKNYMAELVAERLTGQTYEGFSNAIMERGKEQEDAARAMYEFVTGNSVEEIGFVDHPDIPMSGASPDRLVNNDGLLEIKAPNTATHIATLLGGNIPGKYAKQMQWQMTCTGRDWCDFVSYDPRVPAEMQMHIERVYRDREAIAEIEAEVVSFLLDVESTVDRLKRRYGGEK